MDNIEIGTKVKWIDEDKTIKEGYDEDTVEEILEDNIGKSGFNIREDWLKKYYNLKEVKGIGKVKSIEPLSSKSNLNIEIITLNNGREFYKRGGKVISDLKVVK